MFDADKVTEIEKASSVIAEEGRRSLQNVKFLESSSAMRVIADSQKKNVERLSRIAETVPQFTPMQLASPPDMSGALRSLGEAQARKARMEKEVAEATIGNFRATTEMAQVMVKQSEDIARMATEIADTSRLTRWILLVSAVALVVGVAAIVFNTLR
jgi:hypothetical protein